MRIVERDGDAGDADVAFIDERVHELRPRRLHELDLDAECLGHRLDEIASRRDPCASALVATSATANSTADRTTMTNLWTLREAAFNRFRLADGAVALHGVDSDDEAELTRSG